MADPQGSGSAQEAQQEAGDQSKPGGEDGRGAEHADASNDAKKALDAEVEGEASFAQQALISKYAQLYQDWNATTKGLKGERVITRRLYEFLQEWQTGLPDTGERDENDEREGRGRDPVLKGSWRSPGFAEDSLSPEPVRADRPGAPKRGARGFGRNSGTVEKDQRAWLKFGGECIPMRGGFGEVSRGALRSGLFEADGWEGGSAAEEDEMKSTHSRAEGYAMEQVIFFPRSLAQQRSQASPPTDVSMGMGPLGTDASVVQSLMHINGLKGGELEEGDGGARPPRH
uniref:Uncharacterized protein n=1 Tax=Chromera velia CCMP2878 TaxID=1169474 RepID=A0A0G4GM04_9ALVE|eukprot:Cvel_22490.t1-p1 / transcript=Cvel_22490.t1 / gene=Cvel_22490 / organism=Chromera_velia_CCMP2878 / gene_product=hypothetical protein / transcript_product=hypothetical protein / location=Cvel_scaffold2216:2211-4854(+) / protein_length=285 / sequence_SO=supercontig / SO=protein_coding / is_pseudo=false